MSEAPLTLGEKTEEETPHELWKIDRSNPFSWDAR